MSPTTPRTRIKLTPAQSDRAAGVLLAMAAGDALGAGYEFGPPLGPEVPVVMEGGGSFGWAPGEWTDDTSMAVAIAEVSAEGEDLRSVSAQDQIAVRWAGWAAETKDVGIQTRSVLGSTTEPLVDAARKSRRQRTYAMPRPLCTNEPARPPLTGR